MRRSARTVGPEVAESAALAFRYVDLVLLHMARADGKAAMVLVLRASYMPELQVTQVFA